MTIQSTVNDGITYSGNDSATTFAFPFKVDLNTQIEVIIRDALGVETTAVLNTDYTVAGFTVEGSGVVTYPISGDPLATGKKITIKPKMDYLQSTDIRNQGRFAPEIHENAFDTLMMHIKELKGEINRTIQFKKSSEITGAEFGVDPEDGKIVVWDGTTGKTKNVVAVDSALVTTFWETVLANTNLSDSLDDLGIPAFSQTLLAATTAAIARGTLDAEQIINSLTAITTLQDADQIGIADNSDSDNSKKITFANFILQALLDEDDMSSNSDTRGATQQSIKAYVDSLNLYMIVEDQKTAGASGGTPTTGARNTRALNTVVQNDITGASLSSNQVTLPAGKYYIKGYCVGGAVNGHRVFLRNTTDSSDDLLGSTSFCTTNVGINSLSHLEGVVDIASAKVFQLEHYFQSNGGGSSGMGYDSNSGSVEIYSRLIIKKIN